MASSRPEAQPPTMTLLYRMEAKLGERFSLGPVPNGQERIVIPIVGGTFEGPRLSGTKPTILPRLSQVHSYHILQAKSSIWAQTGASLTWTARSGPMRGTTSRPMMEFIFL
jgi:hypothetical protein